MGIGLNRNQPCKIIWLFGCLVSLSKALPFERQLEAVQVSAWAIQGWTGPQKALIRSKETHESPHDWETKKIPSVHLSRVIHTCCHLNCIFFYLITCEKISNFPWNLFSNFFRNMHFYRPTTKRWKRWVCWHQNLWYKICIYIYASMLCKSITIWFTFCNTTPPQTNHHVQKKEMTHLRQWPPVAMDEWPIRGPGAVGSNAPEPILYIYIYGVSKNGDTTK